MKANALRLLLAVVLLAPCAVNAADFGANFNGQLVTLQGNSTQTYTGPELAQEKYIALYYSAGWCGPCHKFTPELVKFYNEMKPKYPGFEVVFMSRDESPNDMEKYMAQMNMPWPALRYSFAKSNPLLNKYCGPGIPCLVVVDQKGVVVADSFKGSVYLGAYQAMDDLKKLLSNEPAGAVTSASPAKPSNKSPTGTDWDTTFKKKSP
ncbi:MAG: redoxin domain-containing protein [Chthoniobacterales bacterium]|nr:redoxin domain-containing protein [Chthoniobacterales bacterium]